MKENCINIEIEDEIWNKIFVLGNRYLLSRK